MKKSLWMLPRRLWLILFAALVLRGIFAAWTVPGFNMDPDSFSYDTIGRRLMTSGTLGDSVQRTPGYPVFLAGVHSLFGDGARAVIAVQSLIATVSVFFVFLIGRRLWNEQVGLLGALLAAVDPFQVYFTAKVLTETLFTFLLVLLVYQLVLLNESDDVAAGRSAATGLLLGIITLVRPEALGLALLVVLGTGIQFMLRKNIRKAAVCSGILLTVSLSVLLPWGLRNKGLTGQFILTSSNGGWTLYEGLSTDLSVQGWEAYRQKNMYPDVQAYGLDSEIKVRDHFAMKSREYIRSHPGTFALLAVRKLFKLYRLVPYEVFSRSARLASFLYFAPLLALFIGGMMVTAREWRRMLPVYLPIIFVTAIHMIFTSQVRYRVPLQPLMALFAAYGLLFFWNYLSVPEKPLCK